MKEEARQETREAVARHRAGLVRQARRKFGEETAEELAALLADVSDPDQLDRVADLIIDCATGLELLEPLRPREVVYRSVALGGADG